MDELVTFRTIPNASNCTFDITVKKEFINKCPHYQTIELIVLLAKFKLFSYLHNPSGPAVIRYDKNGKKVKEEYFLNGDIVTKEELKRG